MARDGAPPFQQPHYDLGASQGGRCVLAPMMPDATAVLGAAFAAIDPWAAYRIAPARLAAFFAAEEAGCCRRLILLDGALAGAVVVRHPWLHGPYLQFLGLLPGREGRGAGAAVLAWMEREAGPGSRNLWLCVSAINARARAFYERHGYRLAGTLDGLAADHMDELLLRKRIGPRAGARQG